VKGAGIRADWVTALAFSPDDRQLAKAGWDGIVTLWDVSHAKFQFKLKGPIAQVWSVAYAPDGKTLAVGHEDGTVQLWDPATGKERATFRHGAAAKCVAFAPDGTTLAAGYEDKVVELWDTEAGKVRTVFRGFAGPVTGVAFAPDGQTLAAAGGPEVKLWDLNLTKK
jgi:WD40 repeat protein